MTSTAWYRHVESANPSPVCRRGGCGELAVEGSEWCADHDASVRAVQEWAQSVREHLRREKQCSPRPTTSLSRCQSCAVRRSHWDVETELVERDGRLHWSDDLGRLLCEGI